jgi:putative flippase GtrA
MTQYGTIARWGAFNVVGVLGFAVQALLLWLLGGVGGLDYLLATALAVEGAVLHNFFWHERWTWAERTGRDRAGRLRRLARFNLTTGVVSMAGNLAMMAALVGVWRLHYLAANVIAIAACSALNFMASDRLVFRLSVLALCSAATRAEAAELQPATVAAWDTYVRLTESRIETELSGPRGFAGIDPRMRARALRGEIPIEALSTPDASGRPAAVPQGEIHHWRGLVFVPGGSLATVLEGARHPERHRQEDVLEARVLEQAGDSMRVYLKLRRSSLVTVVYGTEHQVSFRRHGPLRASSRSVATRIVELDDPGTSRERENPPGRDSGYLWRLNGYWRYEEVEGGVLVECESLSLSREIPSLMSALVRPIANRIAQESLLGTLASLRQRFSAP